MDPLTTLAIQLLGFDPQDVAHAVTTSEGYQSLLGAKDAYLAAVQAALPKATPPLL